MEQQDARFPAPQFPKQLYVNREGEGDDQYFQASEVADAEDGTPVAIYELRDVRTMRITKALK